MDSMLVAALIAIALPLIVDGWLRGARYGMYKGEALVEQGDDKMIAPCWMTQQVDHFDAENDDTFEQRYFVNSTFWKERYGPVFVYIDGEGAASPYDVIRGHHMQLAQEHGALVFAIEHRFYGKTMPTPDLSTHNLRLLSSPQALADIAQFIGFARQKYDIADSSRLITFGGSYSGALSAWFRIKYPHLVYAAVASSAPVQALPDFSMYNDVVGRSLSSAIVGGSPQCTARVREGFRAIDTMLDSGDYRTAADMFRSCSPIATEDDALQLVSDLANIFEGSVQYNNQMSLNIAEICKVMTGESDALTSLKQLFEITSQGVDCVDYRIETMIAQLNDTSVDQRGPVGVRQWTFQTCSQFGYYQTCEAPECIFSARMTLDSNTILCKELFGIDLPYVNSRIAFSNQYYGSNRPAGSRIIFVNGDIDPWHALSVLEDIPAETDETALLMHGTSHCQNMGSTSELDPPELARGKQLIANKVAAWLHPTIEGPIEVISA